MYMHTHAHARAQVFNPLLALLTRHSPDLEVRARMHGACERMHGACERMHGACERMCRRGV